MFECYARGGSGRIVHWRLSLGVCIASLLAACIAFAYTGAKVTDAGAIVGVIKYAGVAPRPVRLEVSKDRAVCGSHEIYDQSLLVGQNGGIANAVVSILNIDRGEPLKPLAAVRFDQKNCEYIPHVAVFPAGSTVEVINSDGILHNIHTESTANPVIDMAQPGFKKIIRMRIEKPEAIRVTCDAHNWMDGWWYVTANPYYGLSDSKGHYEIHNIPPGTYSVQVWQEKLGVQKRQISVKPDATATADFTFNPPPS
jgi:hypothetical protein